MLGRLTLLPLCFTLALLGGCADDGTGAAIGSMPLADPQAPALPDGWRWESFAGVQVGVPGDFGWTNSGQRIGQWCVSAGREDETELRPAVGRPGISTLVGCPTGDPDPSTLVENTGVVVAFQHVAEGAEDPTAVDQGDQSVLTLGDVLVRVIGPADLREQVLATAHRAEIDANGCAMRLPDDVEPGSPPTPALDVSTLRAVSALAACRYSVPSPSLPGPGELLSSLRLEEDEARDVVTAIADAPEGGGPDRPSSCAVDYSYGDEFILVQVDSAEGRSVIAAYYSGCDHNGFDDGTTVRALTRQAIQPLVADGNAPTGFSGPADKVAMLIP